MKLFRVACSAGVLAAALAIAGDASAQSAACNVLTAGTDTVCNFNGRPFRLRVPTSYRLAQSVPLVLDLHGLRGTLQQQSNRSGFVEKSDEVGFVYAAPMGLPAQGFGGLFGAGWNAQGNCCVLSNRPDEQYLRDLTLRLTNIGRVDPERRFVTGFSAGASMSHRLACNAADLFAGAGMVAFQLSGGNANQVVQSCNPAAPLPVIHFHGTADPTIAFNGANIAGVVTSLAAPTSNQAWARIQGCSDRSTVTRLDNRTTCETFDGCDAGVAVSLCSVQGGGHGNVYELLQSPTVADATLDFWQRCEAR